MVINTALQQYRGAQVYRLEDEKEIEETLDSESIEQIGLDDLLAMIHQLPDRYRMVFSMYSLDGYSHKEIAEMMSISEGTSKSNLSRARNSLQEMIKKWRNSNKSNAS